MGINPNRSREGATVDDSCDGQTLLTVSTAVVATVSKVEPSSSAPSWARCSPHTCEGLAWTPLSFAQGRRSLPWETVLQREREMGRGKGFLLVGGGGEEGQRLELEISLPSPALQRRGNGGREDQIAGAAGRAQ